MDRNATDEGAFSILFVDENALEINPFRRLLVARGHRADQLFSADQAFLQLIGGSSHDLIIVDIMLAPGIQKSERFSSANTGRHMEAGITLVQNLLNEGCPIEPHRFVLFTHIEMKTTLAKAGRLKERYGVQLWHKITFVEEPREFVRRVETTIQRVRSTPMKGTEK